MGSSLAMQLEQRLKRRQEAGRTRFRSNGPWIEHDWWNRHQLEPRRPDLEVAKKSARHVPCLCMLYVMSDVFKKILRSPIDAWHDFPWPFRTQLCFTAEDELFMFFGQEIYVSSSTFV